MRTDRRAGEDCVDSVDKIEKPLDSRLPERWQLATLGNVIRGFETGRNFQAAGVPAKAGETGVLKISAVTWGRFDPSANKALLPGSEPLPHERIKAGDLLISRANTTELVGAPVLVEQNYPHLMLPDKILRVLYDSELVDPRFLLQALRSKEARSHIEENATGSSDSMRNLSQPKLREIPIPVPPLPEQKRIADKLDRLLARVDACRERLDRVPALLKRFRQSVLAAATSGELTREWREDQGFEFDWQSSKLGIVGHVSGGITKNSGRSNAPLKKRYLRVANVYANRLNLEDVAEISTNPDEFARTRLVAGDVLIVEGNGSIDQIGRAALWRGELQDCTHQNHLIRWRTRGDVLPEFALYWLLSPIGRDFLVDLAKSSAGLHTLSLSKISSVPISVPSIQEQTEISRRVSDLFAVAETIEERLKEAQVRVTQTTPATLAKAFRGELVPQDPTDEPAAALLARIAATHDDAGAPARRERRKATPSDSRA